MYKGQMLLPYPDIKYLTHDTDPSKAGYYWRHTDGAWLGPFATLRLAEADYDKHRLLTSG